jgi:hypothetical protein
MATRPQAWGFRLEPEVPSLVANIAVTDCNLSLMIRSLLGVSVGRILATANVGRPRRQYLEWTEHR